MVKCWSSSLLTCKLESSWQSSSLHTAGSPNWKQAVRFLTIHCFFFFFCVSRKEFHNCDELQRFNAKAWVPAKKLNIFPFLSPPFQFCDAAWCCQKSHFPQVSENENRLIGSAFWLQDPLCFPQSVIQCTWALSLFSSVDNQTEWF